MVCNQLGTNEEEFFVNVIGVVFVATQNGSMSPAIDSEKLRNAYIRSQDWTPAPTSQCQLVLVRSEARKNSLHSNVEPLGRSLWCAEYQVRLLLEELLDRDEIEISYLARNTKKDFADHRYSMIRVGV